MKKTKANCRRKTYPSFYYRQLKVALKEKVHGTNLSPWFPSLFLHTQGNNLFLLLFFVSLMAFNLKKLLQTPIESNETGVCPESCIFEIDTTGFCPLLCSSSCSSRCPPSPPWFLDDSPPPLPPPLPQMTQNHDFPPLILIIVAILGSTLLLVTYYTIIKKYFSIRNSSRRTPPPQSDDTHEEFLDDNHDLVVDHPIWFITTVGLQQSIINSITICKYKRGEGLIEGTECSVCLNEFQEDETLRLLPKCSHAFHPPCIDTWLRSHTNCPLCRARIVSNTTVPNLSTTEPNYENLGMGEETPVENSERDGGLGNDQIREGEVSEMGVGTRDLGELRVEDGRRDTEIEKGGVPSPHVNCEFRALSDLVDNYQVAEDEVQPVRRSVSMDSSSASMICLALANFIPVEAEGNSATQSVQAKNSNVEIVPKQVGGNQSILKKIGSSYIGRSLQKGPISMKRSFSCGGKFLLSRSSQSRNSVLPL